MSIFKKKEPVAVKQTGVLSVYYEHEEGKSTLVKPYFKGVPFTVKRMLFDSLSRELGLPFTVNHDIKEKK